VFPFSATWRIPALGAESPLLTISELYQRLIGDVNHREKRCQKSVSRRETPPHRQKDDRLPLPPDNQILEIFPALLGRRERDLLEDMRRRRLRRHKRQLHVIDNPVRHGPELHDETEAKSRVSF
jgi:hypothetical protein